MVRPVRAGDVAVGAAVVPRRAGSLSVNSPVFNSIFRPAARSASRPRRFRRMAVPLVEAAALGQVLSVRWVW